MIALDQNLAHRELIVLNILKYNFCVYDMSRDDFAKIVNYYPVGGRFNERSREITFFWFILNIYNI